MNYGNYQIMKKSKALAISEELEYGDKARIVELTKTKGLNEGNGYSYIMVVKVLRGERENESIVALVKEFIENRKAFKASLTEK